MTYRFNKEGYRCDEFDKPHDLAVMVVGCSVAFGTGVVYKETFGKRFLALLAKQNDSQSPVLYNLSDGGQGNDYIARTTVEWFDRLQPDVTIIQLSHYLRYEYIDHFGNYVNLFKEPLDMVGKEVKSHFDLVYNENYGMMNTYKNVLLLQEFFKNRNHHYLFCGLLPIAKAMKRSVSCLEPIRSKVDFSRFDLVEMDYDFGAADHQHPSSGSHGKYARSLFDTFAKPVIPLA